MHELWLSLPALPQALPHGPGQLHGGQAWRHSLWPVFSKDFRDSLYAQERRGVQGPKKSLTNQSMASSKSSSSLSGSASCRVAI